MRARVTAAIASGVLVLGAAAHAQDFESPWPAEGPASFLDRGLAPASANAALEMTGTRWLGIAALETRAVAACAGWRSARCAAGVSSTGDAGAGWTAVAIAAGASSATSGAAFRALARRDRAGLQDFAGAAPEAGVEMGAGAWLNAGPALRLSASAPQLWTDGAAPPLARGLTLEARIEGGTLALWLARESARLGGAYLASHRGGIRWRAGPLGLVFEARDGPLRGAFGLETSAGAIGVAARIESHPVAGETTTLGLRVGAAP